MTTNNPWHALDAATQEDKLYLEPELAQEIRTAFDTYEVALQQLITDALDDTTGYFGTDKNPLALLLEQAFNDRGKVLTDYLKEQLSQAQAFVKTAEDAAAALRANEGD
jgi:hypothetical protein